MANTKNKKLAAVIDNTALADDAVVQIGEHSLTMGELRAMDNEHVEGGPDVTELEQREQNILTAQSNLGSILIGVSEATGVTVDDLLAGKFEGLSKKQARQVVRQVEGTEGELDPKMKKAIETMLAPVTKTLEETRRAMGTIAKVGLDQFYQDRWDEKLFPNIPKGTDGKPAVKIDLQSLMKYADDNKILDRQGRLNLDRAFDDLTREAKFAARLAEAEKKGEERGRQAQVAANMPKPGVRGPITPQTFVKERQVQGPRGIVTVKETKDFGDVINDALNDQSIVDLMVGNAGAA